MDDYVGFRSNPANDHITDGQWCGQRNLLITELLDWKATNSEAMLTILEKRRSQYAASLIEVDQALFAKAKSGDAKAIELLWSRFEGWTAKIEENNAKQGLGKAKTLADLMGEL